jgi:hypothetical protein
MDLNEYGEMLNLHGDYANKQREHAHGLDMQLADRLGTSPDRSRERPQPERDQRGQRLG